MQSRLSTLPGLVISVIAAVAVIACTVLVTRAFIEVKGTESMIRVTGSARKAIKSDYIIWSGRVSVRSENLNAAYGGLKSGVDQAKKYLIANGVPKEEVFDLPISTRTLYEALPKTQYGYEDEGNVYRKIVAYELSQAIETVLAD